jgi:hypothetical protein
MIEILRRKVVMPKIIDYTDFKSFTIQDEILLSNWNKSKLMFSNSTTSIVQH